MSEKTYWHIAKGDGSRDTSEIFIRYGVAAIGPGDWGDFRKNLHDRTWSRFVKYLAKEVLPGHRIVLQSAAREILAVGVVCPSGDAPPTNAFAISPAYTYHEAFGDLDGMDWQHVVRVNWHKIHHKFKSDICGPRFSRLGRISSIEVREFVEKNLPSENQVLPDLPPEPVRLKVDDLTSDLFDSGLANTSVELTENAIRRIQRQLSWYRKAGNPKEQETVSHMVVPLLLGLGWSEQQLAVEWKNIDIVAFGTANNPKEVRRPSNCRMIVEVKRISEGLWWAGLQAHQYLKKYGLSECCERVVLTDGVRYNVLDCKGQTSYYINFDPEKLFTHTIDGKKSVDALRWMQPYVAPK